MISPGRVRGHSWADHYSKNSPLDQNMRLTTNPHLTAFSRVRPDVHTPLVADALALAHHAIAGNCTFEITEDEDGDDTSIAIV